MKTDNRNRGTGKNKSIRRPEQVGQITLGNMHMFLQYLTPSRLQLLGILQQCIVPMSEKVLAGIMLKQVKEIHVDVVELERDGIIERTASKKLFVLWDSIQITVRQDRPYAQNQKVSNIVDAVLVQYVRKYSWLHAKLESTPKLGRSRTFSFNCVLELLVNCE
ncbi:MAG: hypothetical protein AB9919_13015 [Geobacteraceae bacterium]